jgi:hypothetical protein
MIKISKNYLIIGCGITGSKIATELSKFGNVFVSDILEKESLSIPNNSQFIKYSSDRKFIINLASKYDLVFDSVVHTYIQNTETAQIFINQISKSVVRQVVTLGTLMTYNQKTWNKIDLNSGFFWNEYQFQKWSVELMLEKYCSENNIQLFVPETFHILGAGFGIGIVGPYFRMNQSELKNYTTKNSITLPSNKPLAIIDNLDFACYIARGVNEGLQGYCPIYNPNFITPTEYYSIVNQTLDLDIVINIVEKPEIQPKCMNQSWTPSFIIPKDFIFTDIRQSIQNTVSYLLNIENPQTRNIREKMITAHPILNNQMVL